MKAETAQFAEFARDMLDRAERMLSIGLTDDAGRACDLVCYHVAQAVIFEREGRVLKTNRGVQSEFHRILKEDPAAELREALRETIRFHDTFTALLSLPSCQNCSSGSEI